MQKATVTITVFSDGDKFKLKYSDIVKKAVISLMIGLYTADIEDVEPEEADGKQA